MQILTLPVAAIGPEWNEKSLDIDRVIIALEGDCAIISVDYELHGVIVFYVFVLGGKVIEPILNELITDAEDLEILSMTKDGAKFSIAFDTSRTAIAFSQEIPIIIVEYPDQRQDEFRDTSLVRVSM
jgi:hypothetical protein